MVSSRLMSCLRDSADGRVSLGRCEETVFLSENRPACHGSTVPGCWQCEEAIQVPDCNLQDVRAKGEEVYLAL
jgi:hypothetical protein